MLIAKNKISDSALSDVTGIFPNTLYALYHEWTKNTDTKTIMKLCKYFDVTPNNVLELKNIRKLSNGNSKNTCRTNKGNTITETTQVIVNTIYCAPKAIGELFGYSRSTISRLFNKYIENDRGVEDLYLNLDSTLVVIKIAKYEE